MYSLPMNLHKHEFYLLEQHNESFKIWSAIIRINTEGKIRDYEWNWALGFYMTTLYAAN